ncbi:hypothetical protein LshimejAT787_1105260 [Lyophyllum shimeji]|uniref:DUF6699 domain-containing protein n=1 Tax=Lyophyllum shimeji TaxID=47721 RepID=A0A9P3PWJ7_LYOSH|nr:hypothetical protein LshimejAT787_1105260 [Lyophyllum shimeji]
MSNLYLVFEEWQPSPRSSTPFLRPFQSLFLKMARKTVRFRNENEVYADVDYVNASRPSGPTPPHTPSPTFSAATLSANSSPATPPAFVNHSPVYNQKHSLPDFTLGGTAAELPVELTEDTDITFNLEYPPLHDRNGLDTTVGPALYSPATNAPVMRIQCSMLPWRIEISPAPGMAYITVLDVLQGIYDALQLRATPSELQNETPFREQQIQASHECTNDALLSHSGHSLRHFLLLDIALISVTLVAFLAGSLYKPLYLGPHTRFSLLPKTRIFLRNTSHHRFNMKPFIST